MLPEIVRDAQLNTPIAEFAAHIADEVMEKIIDGDNFKDDSSFKDDNKFVLAVTAGVGKVTKRKRGTFIIRIPLRVLPPALASFNKTLKAMELLHPPYPPAALEGGKGLSDAIQIVVLASLSSCND